MIYLDQEIVLLQDQYQMFTNMGEMFPALTVLAIASGKSLNSIMPWLNRWLNPHDPLAHLIPLLNGDDLKTELGLTAGQKIGDLLNELKLAQVNQIITNRHNAIAFAKTLI
jgi:tRNA nucleotidyltransferase (CCA-adding enzyme)